MRYVQARIVLDKDAKPVVRDFMCADTLSGPFIRYKPNLSEGLAVELSWNPMRRQGESDRYPAAVGYNSSASEDLADEIEAWFRDLDLATNPHDILERSKRFIDGSLSHVQLLDVNWLRKICAERLAELGFQKESSTLKASVQLAE